MANPSGLSWLLTSLRRTPNDGYPLCWSWGAVRGIAIVVRCSVLVTIGREILEMQGSGATSALLPATFEMRRVLDSVDGGGEKKTRQGCGSRKYRLYQIGTE